MQIEMEEKIQSVTHIEALAALWRVKIRLGQYPIHVFWTEADAPSEVEKQKGSSGC